VSVTLKQDGMFHQRFQGLLQPRSTFRNCREIIKGSPVPHHITFCMPQSQNFFAALDDSGDEAPAPSKSTVKKREPKPTKKADASKDVPKVDDR
jgi:hypothetical protein